MKNITILLVLIFTFLFSTTCWGEWTFVSEGVSGGKYYYDKDKVRKNGKYIYFWDLQDLKKPNEGSRTLSSMVYVQLDCSVFRFKWLSFKSYIKSMGEGKTHEESTPPDKWMYPSPDSIREFMYNEICEKHQ